jgi:hypothetical protein
MAVQNFSTALRMTMPTIVQKYLRHFELHQRAAALRHVSRFRKLPSWMPSKAPLLKLMTRNSLGWVHRSGIQPLPGRKVSVSGAEGKFLLDRNIDGGRKLTGSGIPINSDIEGSGIDLSASDPAAARSHNQAQAENGAESEKACQTPVWPIAYQGEADYPKGQQASGVDGGRIPPMG